MKSIKTEIIINAPVQQVWKVLTDFNAYSEWNTLIVDSQGEAIVGTKLINTLQLEGQKPQTFKPTILVAETNQSLRWIGHLFIKGLFDGEHYFELLSLDERTTRLTHGENFSGLLANVVLKLQGDVIHNGFEKMNEALKKRAEDIFVGLEI